jgi:transposase
MPLMVMKNYPPEFKADAVALVLSRPDRTLTSIARDLGSAARLCGCGCALRRPRAPAVQRAGPLPVWPASAGHLPSDDVLEEENKQLRARIRELELERDILRRAAKLFAGETNW